LPTERNESVDTTKEKARTLENKTAKISSTETPAARPDHWKMKQIKSRVVRLFRVADRRKRIGRHDKRKRHKARRCCGTGERLGLPPLPCPKCLRHGHYSVGVAWAPCHLRCGGPWTCAQSVKPPGTSKPQPTMVVGPEEAPSRSLGTSLNFPILRY
jgi:hypothetical protein